MGLLGGDASRIHVNPDCGLKTRRWEEVLPSLHNMVAAARLVRAELGAGIATAGTSAAANGAAPVSTGAKAGAGSCTAGCCLP